MLIQRLEQKCPLTPVTEVPQRTFKLLLCSNLLLSLLATCSQKFPFITYADNISHSSSTASPTLREREQRSCTIELNLNLTAYKGEGNDCEMWNGPVSCKDINRRNSYEQGLLEKSTGEAGKAAECIAATTTCRNKYILFLCRTKLAYEDLKALLKCLMMHSSWWETGFIVIYQQKQRPRWQEALLQAQQDWWSLGMKQNQVSPQPLPFTPILLP